MGKYSAGLCIECHERPITIVRRRLCATCYNRLRTAALKTGGDRVAWEDENPRPCTKKEYAAEINFISVFFKHRNWIYQPASFSLGDVRYTPDFYDGDRNVFIEVVGSRQAFHQNKEKYELFVKKFPKIAFEIRDSKGAFYQPS